MSFDSNNSKRLRQIAVLVSIVDTAAAHQLLTRLPAELAQQVLALLPKLGDIGEEERAHVLRLFQNPGAASPAPTPATRPQQPAAPPSKSVTPTIHAANEQLDSSLFTPPDTEPDEEFETAPDSIWARLDRRSILSFLKGERPSIIAVVLSQLSSRLAVSILQALGPQVSSEAMRCLSRLQDIDSETRAALDDYIKERLGERQLDVIPSQKNSRRVDAMLQLAPAELRQVWEGAIAGESFESITVLDSSPDVRVEATATADTASNDGFEDLHRVASPAPSVKMHQPHPEPVAAPTASVDAALSDLDNSPPQTETEDGPDSSESRQAAAEDVPTIPFSPSETRQPMDRSRLQFEFERVLSLQPILLAELLSSIPTHTVLLALAGAPPTWMRRFYKMLNRADANALKQRLKNVGSLTLADIDLAQTEIIEKADELRQRVDVAFATSRAA